MKILNKTISVTIFLTILFSGQSVMADEFPNEGARDDYSDHPHFTSSELSQTDNTTRMKRANYMLHHNIEGESSLDEELFPNPEQ